MTDQSEVEKVADLANLMLHKYNLGASHYDVAEWLIKKRDIAVLEGKIEELQRNCYGERPGDRFNNLQSRLAELRKEKV